MARYYKKKRSTTTKRYRKPKVTMGDKFTTRKGRYGCYKYVNGRRVAFVGAKRPSRRRY